MELYGPLQKGEILTHDRILRNTRMTFSEFLLW